MRVLDANVFLRFIVRPQNDFDHVANRLARVIFDEVRSRTNSFSTSPAVIVEVLHVLTSANIYGYTREDAYLALENLPDPPGCAIGDRQTLVDALSIWESTPKLSYVDAFCRTMARRDDSELVTFDTDLAKAAGTTRRDRRSRLSGNVEES